MICSKTATFISSGEKVKGNNIENRRIEIRTEPPIMLIDRVVRDGGEKSRGLRITRRVGNRY